MKEYLDLAAKAKDHSDEALLNKLLVMQQLKIGIGMQCMGRDVTTISTRIGEMVGTLIKSNGILTCKDFLAYTFYKASPLAKDEPELQLMLFSARMNLYNILMMITMLSQPQIQVEIVKHNIPKIIADDLTHFYLEWKGRFQVNPFVFIVSMG